jgi:hypothetical protein
MIFLGMLLKVVSSVNIFYFFRQLEDHETFYVVLNVGSEQETIILSEHFKDVPFYMIVRSSSINAWHAEK